MFLSLAIEEHSEHKKGGIAPSSIGADVLRYLFFVVVIKAYVCGGKKTFF